MARASAMEFAAFMALVVIVTTYRWLSSRDRANRRRLVKTKRTQLHQLRPGIARVTGTVRRGPEVLLAPLSQRPCVAFEVRVEQYDGEDWGEKVRVREARPFAVVDETGEALVDPSLGFELLLDADVSGTDGGWFDDNAPFRESNAAQALLHAHGIRTETWFFERPIRMRYFEGVVEEGELVSIYGPVIEGIDPQGEKVAPRSVPVARILRGSPDEPVRIGDGSVAREGLAPDRD
jgi:hypothetical protein